MASRLRRALIWLRLQPASSVGSPFFLPPTYVCATCGALVAADRREQHDAWDQRVGG
jgi:hypothetical protein